MPLNHTVLPVEAVKVPPVPDMVPASFSVLVPKSKTPVVLVKLGAAAVRVWVRPAPRFNVPAPFIVKAEALTLPVKVKVPAVREKVTSPVVVKPATDGEPVEPESTMGEALAVNVPFLVNPCWIVAVKLVPVFNIAFVAIVKAPAKIAVPCMVTVELVLLMLTTP